MQDAKAKIDRIINEGSEFKFGDYISRGFEIFQKNMGGFIGFAFLFFLISIVIGLIPILGSIANSLFIGPALMAGGYLVAHKVDRGESTEFSDFFKGFDFTGQLALAALVTAILAIISLIPFGIACWGWNEGIIEWYRDAQSNPTNPPGFPDLPPWWSFFLLLPVIYLSIAYSWTYLFIVLYRMDFWPAMEASRRLLTKHWLFYFLFAIVIGLIAAAGALLLCVGLLATFPAMLCMTYAAFADVTKLNEVPDAGNEIEQHLVD
jgi:hypothetical protein